MATAKKTVQASPVKKETAKKMIVLMQKGWDKSEGVKREIDLANEMGIPIEYAEVEEEKNV